MSKPLQLKVDVDDLKKHVSRMFRGGGVAESFELERIVALPRRDWKTDTRDNVNIEELVEMMTRAFRRPKGKFTLWPHQARTLQELHDFRGAFSPIDVGGGKTIITFLAPTIIECKNPLLVIPAKLREKTSRDFVELRKHFYGDPPPFVSYEQISRENGAEILQEHAPDLLILDECHLVKNKSASCTRKIRSWIQTHPETAVVALSGTFTKRSLHDFAHILEWTMGKRRMPIPTTVRDLDEWARAVDVEQKFERQQRLAPGALVKLYGEAEHEIAKKEPLRAARLAVRRRLHETAGVVSVQDGVQVGASLNVEVRPVEGYGERIEALFARMNAGVLPNGDPVTDSNLAARWAKSRELTSGFYYEWDPKPPEDWLLARRAWKTSAASVLDRHLPGLESEGMISSVATRHGAAGLHRLGVGKDLAKQTAAAWQKWEATRNTFKPNRVPRWESDRMVEEISKWAKKHKGLIWISEVALGERLEAEGIVPYYANKGLDKRGKFVEDAKSKDGSIALSLASNAEGRNLQKEWSDNLMVSCPPTGTSWEQCLDEKTEVLTDHGWIGIDDFKDSMRVAAYDLKDGSTRWSKGKKVERALGEEKMFGVQSAYLDIRVTAGHRMVVEKDGERFFKNAEDIIEKDRIPVCISLGFFDVFGLAPRIEKYNHLKERMPYVSAGSWGVLPSSPDERVWCVTVDTGAIVTRRNDKVAVVGNCLGRTHRPGQTADEVWFDVLIGCSVEYECWLQANKDAANETVDGRKKLTYCSKTVEKMPWGSGPLWPGKKL